MYRNIPLNPYIRKVNFERRIRVIMVSGKIHPASFMFAFPIAIPHCTLSIFIAPAGFYVQPWLTQERGIKNKNLQ